MVDAGRLRIAFFGTPEFAVPTLEALLRSRHAVVGVVTRADRPRGRGQKTSEPAVKSRAIAAGLPVLQPERLTDEGFLAAFTALEPDLGIVAAYGKILTDRILATPRFGMLNVHASLLPRYRGAAPVHRAVINGDTETGVTIMRMVKALDAGPMLATVRRAIGADDTSEEVERDLGLIGAALLVETTDRLASAAVAGAPQDEAAATYAARITKADGVVDWTQPAARIHNLIRGLYPWPHASTFYRGRRLILLRSAVPEPPDEGSRAVLLAGSHASGAGHGSMVSSGSASAGPTAAAGTILEAAGDRLLVTTGRGILAITRIQAEGKRPMTAREFLAGSRLEAGERFTAQP